MDLESHPFLKLLGKTTVVKKDNTTIVGAEAFKEKEYLIVYIGAGYLAGPAKRNLEVLKAFYGAVKDQKVELVYLGQDSTQKEFEKHFQSEANADWYALSPKEAVNAELMKALDNPTVPHIIVFNQKGYIVKNSSGVKDLSDLTQTAALLKKWKEQKEKVARKKDTSKESKESRDH